MTKKTSAVAPKRSVSFKIACRSEIPFTFAPERTALVVVDMQRDFFSGPDEDQGDDPMREIIPRVARLIAVARSLGCQLVHTREGYAPDLSDVSDYRKSLEYVGRKGPTGHFLIRGEWGHDFLDEVRPLPGETIIDKPGFSAFYRSTLAERLQDTGVTHLILCGVTTQCCVQSTLREAVDRGYWCLTVADCCAAENDDLHEAALRLIAGEGDLFGWVCDVSDIEQGTGSGIARLAGRIKPRKK